MKEKSYRSFMKSLTYRVLGTINTFFISWLITGEIMFAVSISFIEMIAKMALYYLHERAWDKIKFGKYHKPPDYQI